MLEIPKGSFADITLSLLRVVSGALFMQHGAQKLRQRASIARNSIQFLSEGPTAVVSDREPALDARGERGPSLRN